MTALRVPPGRVGRLWLRRRLDVATRAADLLEQKLRALRDEERRLAILVEETEAEWVRTAREASTWLLRASVAGGERSLRLAASTPPATVDLGWIVSMGVRYPAQARAVTPDRSAAIPGGAALILTGSSHDIALRAAVRHAAALAAMRIVRREVETTRNRVRALSQSWIPRLREALSRRELELEELERAENVRRRRAASLGKGGTR